MAVTLRLSDITVVVLGTSRVQVIGHEYHQHGSQPCNMTQLAIAAVHHYNVIHAQHLVVD
jgi:hypothetical protein